MDRAIHKLINQLRQHMSPATYVRSQSLLYGGVIKGVSAIVAQCYQALTASAYDKFQPTALQSACFACCALFSKDHTGRHLLKPGRQICLQQIITSG